MNYFTSLLTASLMATAFVACDDDHNAAPDSGNAISFNASAPLRELTTTNTLRDFKVWETCSFGSVVAVGGGEFHLFRRG